MTAERVSRIPADKFRLFYDNNPIYDQQFVDLMRI